MKFHKIICRFGVKKCCMFLVAVFSVSLFSDSASFSEENKSPSSLQFINDKVMEKIKSPLNKVQDVVDLISSNYERAFNDTVVAQRDRSDLNWVFEADGISVVSPVVNQDDGTILASTTDIDIEVDVKNLPTEGHDAITVGKLKSNVYALKPNPVRGKGNDKWVFTADNSVIIFPPIFSDDQKIFFEAISADIDIQNKTFGNFGTNLYAVNQDDGSNAWGPIEFKGEITLAPPVATPDMVITTTLQVADFSDFDINNLSAKVTAFDSATGNKKWTFSPAALEGELPSFIIAPPAVDAGGNTIYVNAISTVSEEEIKEFVNNSVTAAQDDILFIIEETIPALLDALINGNDINPILDPAEETIEGLFDNIANDLVDEFTKLGEVIALDQNGAIKWRSGFPGVSLTSPVVSDAGIVTVGSVNFLIEDVASQVDIFVELSDEGILSVKTKVGIEVAGISVGIEVNLNVNIDDLANGTIPEDVKPEIIVDKPDLENLSIALNGAVTAFDPLNGDLLWKTKVGEPVLLKPVVSNDGKQVIIGASNFTLEKEDGDDEDGGDGNDDGSGNVKISSPVSKIYSIETAGGSVEWESDSFDGVIGLPVLDSIIGDPLLLAPDGSVAFSFYDKGKLKIGAVNDGGSMKWANPFEPDDLAVSPPIINPNDGMVFFTMSKVKDLLEGLPTPGEPDKGGERPKLRDLGLDLKGAIIGLDPVAGTISKSIEIEGFVVSSPAIGVGRNSTIYASTIDLEIGKKPVSVELKSFVSAAGIE